jgi:hypothetical protein
MITSRRRKIKKDCSESPLNFQTFVDSFWNFVGEIPVLPFVDKVKAALLTCSNMVIILTYKTSSTFLIDK